MNKILLIGNPNVGKSVFFTELTGIHAVSSNFAGTTVSVMSGGFTIGEREYTLVDVPGTYSLTPTCEAEKVAAEFLANKTTDATAVICVLDATNLERNLHLALEVQAKLKETPVIYALNLVDVAQRRGLEINHGLLAQELNAPVVPTVAVKGTGLAELKKSLERMLDKRAFLLCANCTRAEVSKSAREITRRACKRVGAKVSFADKLGEAMLKPLLGLPIAALVLAVMIAVVVGGGKLLQERLLLPLVNGVVVPFFREAFMSFMPESVFRNILIGEYGIFVISFQWIIALILPYVFLFYVCFSFLEDSGYLPRLGTLFDGVMRKVGVSGSSLIYTLMGLGCAVPAIIGTRAATTHKERVVISSAICFAVPCVSQVAALAGLLSRHEWWLFPAVFAFAIVLFAASARVAGKVVKGEVSPLILEIPNLLMPEPKAYGRKLLTRMKHFLKDAEVPMLAAVVLAAVLQESGVLAAVAEHAQPLVTWWLGMPPDSPEVVSGMILGIIRREMMVAPLVGSGVGVSLTSLQAFVWSVVSLMYLPCLSVFAILAKEFKLRVAVGVFALTVLTALLTGGLINQIASLLM